MSLSVVSGKKTVGIVGAGLMGRLLALLLSESGWRVTLFDRDGIEGTAACAYVGAGMLAPLSELETAEPLIARLGLASLPQWEALLSRLDMPVFYRRNGTLIVAHALDMPDLTRLRERLKARIDELPETLLPATERSAIEWRLSRERLLELEPELGESLTQGIWLPTEGQIDNRQIMQALAQALKQRNVEWREHADIQSVEPKVVKESQFHWRFNWVMDSRGLGSGRDWPVVRGVRGEIVRVHAPEVCISRPIRLMHPRYPVYIVPRAQQHYLIGATSIESEDFRPMTVQSAMELLSAAFAVHPGFGEASVQEMNVHCRPALPDNLPQVRVETEGLIRINGLYRHGFLITPAVAQAVQRYLETGTIRPEDQTFFDVNASREALGGLRYAAIG